MSTKIALTVHYEDGRAVDVTVGQRELAAFEAQPFGRPDGRYLLLRYAAYDGLRRLGKLPRDRKDRQLSWDDWNDQVDEVVDADEGEEGEPVDPTRPTPLAAG